ncbi:MAG: hypothetical protein ACK52A_10975, partial [Planctomycetota bacterium]
MNHALNPFSLQIFLADILGLRQYPRQSFLACRPNCENSPLTRLVNERVIQDSFQPSAGEPKNMGPVEQTP